MQAPHQIVIAGTGGFAREVKWLLENINRAGHQAPLEFLGFCGPKPENQASWIGTDAQAIEACDPATTVFAVGVGDPVVRQGIAVKFLEAGFQAATLIHPGVNLSTEVEIGEGPIITAGVVLTVNIKIGSFAILNLNATIGHDVKIGDFSTISPGTNISGNVEIGGFSQIGSGSTLLPGVKTGPRCIIGAGSVVTKDMPAGAVCYGNPAKPVRMQ